MTTTTTTTTRLFQGLTTTKQPQCTLGKNDGDIDINGSNDPLWLWTRLTDTEHKMLQGGMSPISTITWFYTSSSSGGGKEEAAGMLKERVQAILVKNPWLAGRIEKKPPDGTAYLTYPRSWTPPDNNVTTTTTTATTTKSTTKDDHCHYKGGSVFDSMFCNLAEPIGAIHRQTPVAEMAKILTDAKILLRARHDTDQPLWKIIVLPCANAPSTRFAVIVSMSHIVGDGSTFYTLHNALMAASASATTNNNIIPELIPTRIETTMQQQTEVLGKAEESLFRMPGFIFTILWGVFLTKVVAPLWFGKQLRAQSHYFFVDMDEMKRCKKAAVEKKSNGEDKTSGPSFVSTNDVLTSWFFQSSKCQIGRMAINFRNRLEGHTDRHAGNYENAVLYRAPQDTASPTLIRQSLQQQQKHQPNCLVVKRAVTANDPPRNGELWRANISLISNWSSFASAELAQLSKNDHDCQQDVHLPLFDVASLLPTTLALCVIFQARPNQLGVMVTGTPYRMSHIVDPKHHKAAPFLVPSPIG